MNTFLYVEATNRITQMSRYLVYFIRAEELLSTESKVKGDDVLTI